VPTRSMTVPAITFAAWITLVGPTGIVSIPRPARNTATAKRLWSEAERLTGTQVPN
jgi:hypothetical protein